MLIANNKSEKDIVPCMGFELGSLHSATADVIINNPSLSATPPSWVGSAVSNSVVYLAAERIHLYIEINNMRASLVWVFFAYKKILGRTETRTRDRMYLGRIRSVRDISRGDQARIATCRLQTPTDRLKANYSVDIYYRLLLHSSFPTRGRHTGFSISSCFYLLYPPPSLQPQPCPLSAHP